MKNEIILFENQDVKLEVNMNDETVLLTQEQMSKLFRKTINLIDIANRVDDNLKGTEAREIIRVISECSKALTLLDDYDHKKVSKPKGNIDNKRITYEECIDIIHKLKENNNSSVFALERSEGLKSIIGAVYQSYDGVDLYKSVEEKAANLLYLITKNHVFIDGNKRIAAT